MKMFLFSVALMYPQQLKLTGIFKLHFRVLTPAVFFCDLNLLKKPLHVSNTMCSTSGGQNFIIQPLVSSHL